MTQEELLRAFLNKGYKRELFHDFIEDYRANIDVGCSELEALEKSYIFAAKYEEQKKLGFSDKWAKGVHKDDLEMKLGEYALKQVGSQGQQRTFVLAMKLAQALYLSRATGDGLRVTGQQPILLLDDIFDRLDSERVERIVEMVQSDEFGQIFITDTDRQHLTEILRPNENAKIFHVENGQIA